MGLTQEKANELAKSTSALFTKHYKEFVRLVEKLDLPVVGVLQGIALTDDSIVVAATKSDYRTLCAMLASVIVCTSERSGVPTRNMLRDIKATVKHKACYPKKRHQVEPDDADSD